MRLARSRKCASTGFSQDLLPAMLPPSLSIAATMTGHGLMARIRSIKGAFTPPPATPPVPPVFDTDSPGGRKYPATWTDLSENLWLFGGDGWTYTFPNAPQPIILNDMWEYTGTQNYSGSFSNFWSAVTPAGLVPVARTGAVTWTSAAGELWLFGGQDGSLNFLNDLWKYTLPRKPGLKWVASSSSIRRASTPGLLPSLVALGCERQTRFFRNGLALRWAGLR